MFSRNTFVLLHKDKDMDKGFHEQVCCCALNRIFGFRPKIAIALISGLGSASAVFDMDSKDIDGLLGPFSPYAGRICRKAYEEAEKELEKLLSEGYRFIPFGHSSYPSLLKECEDAPSGLYMKSVSPPEEVFNSSTPIAVVGTRDISGYGREWCIRTVKALASPGCRTTIVSGLAIGTDITAHRTAIESGIPTIAVMATGIDSVYPFRHMRDADVISSTPGCALITDYPPGSAPLRINFLRRNRIIAGMSKASILIESKVKGGGILTARLAFSYSRDVFALPGRADDIRSAGCNILIREKVAEAITSEKALMDSLGIKTKDRWQEKRVEALTCSFSPGQGKTESMTHIVRAIRENRGITAEEIACKSGMGYRNVIECISMLEADGIIYTDLMQRCFIRLK